MGSPLKLLILLMLTIQPVYAGVDGRWKLLISGHDQLEFGSRFLAGGLTLGWQSILDFSIRDGRFEIGTASARLMPNVDAFSNPPAVFDCSQVSGIFANRSGNSFSTPHLRYQAFPLAGRVIDGKVELTPFLEYPGNYYAIMYQCETSDERGANWAEMAPRIGLELGRRQNAQIDVDEGRYTAKIKQVKVIAPGPRLELPLIDGFELAVEENYGARKLRYQLQRVPVQ
jgi:hypothetical protein